MSEELTYCPYCIGFADTAGFHHSYNCRTIIPPIIVEVPIHHQNNKLKPCPFCGSANIVKPKEAEGRGWQCRYCGSEAFIDWNTRPIEDALQRKLEIAVEALKKSHKEISSTTGTYSRVRAIDIIVETLKQLEEKA